MPFNICFVILLGKSMKAMIIMHLRDQMQKVMIELERLRRFGYRNTISGYFD